MVNTWRAYRWVSDGFLSMFWLLNSVFVYLCTRLCASTDILTVYQCSGYSVSLPVGLDFWLMMEVHTEGLRSSPVSLEDGMQQECDWERKHTSRRLQNQPDTRTFCCSVVLKHLSFFFFSPLAESETRQQGAAVLHATSCGWRLPCQEATDRQRKS